MSATTPYLNLYKPGGGSTGLILPDEVVDVDRFNANSDLIDTWANDIGTKMAAQLTRNQQYRGLAANIGAVTSPVKGDTYQETDSPFRKWEHDGSNWVTGESGCYLIRPTSVVNGAVNVDGAVVPSNGVNGSTLPLSLNGIFSARFSKYVIEYAYLTSAAVGSSFKFRTAGTDYGTADYSWQLQQLDSGVQTLSKVLNQTQAPVAGWSDTNHNGKLEFWNPRASGRIKPFRVLDYVGTVRWQEIYGHLGNAGGMALVPDGITFALSNTANWDSTSDLSWFKVYGYE